MPQAVEKETRPNKIEISIKYKFTLKLHAILLRSMPLIAWLSS